MSQREPCILGVIQNLSFQYKKGSAFYNLLTTLQEQNNLGRILDIDLPWAIKKLLTLLNASPTIVNWKFKEQIDTKKRHVLSYHGCRLLRREGVNFNSVLQIGSMFDLSPFFLAKGIPCFSYHDNNLFGFLRGTNRLPNKPELIQKAKAYESKVYKNLSGVFTISKTLQKSFISDFRLDESKVHYAGFGSPFAGLPIEDKDYSQKNILFIAIHSFEQKGGSILLKAFRKIKSYFPDARLIIVGQELNIQEPGVECLGFINKNKEEGIKIYRQLYQDASLFVLPSYNEAFGEVFIEAMAHKVPCIGADCCAMPEIIKGNDCGDVIPPGDDAALARLMHQYLSDENALYQMGENGYRAVQNEYNWETVSSRIIRVISQHI